MTATPSETFPPEWDTPPVYARYSVQLGKMLDEKRIAGTHLAPYLRNVDVQWEGINTDDLPLMDFSDGDRKRYALKEGDLLVCEGGEVGRTAIWSGELDECFFQKAVHRLRPTTSNDEPRFFRYFMRMAVDRGLFTLRTASTIAHLTAEQLRVLRYPSPPRAQQRAIADYLDRETARLDALVAVKERLLGLLAEKRRALITRAVTRGLDPHAPIRDSGIPWLGEIPAHWRQERIKRLFRYQKRQGFEDLTVLSVYRDFGVIEKHSRDDNANRTPDDLTPYQLVERGDLVINKMKAWQGSLGISGYRGITSPDYVVYTPTHGEEERFLHYALRSGSMADVYRTNSNGIRPNQWRLEPDRFEQIELVLPPIEEQRRISAFIDERTSRLDSLSAMGREAIVLLLERRAALIASSVTGQLEVGSASA